jgi:voltage-gated potassium channel
MVVSSKGRAKAPGAAPAVKRHEIRQRLELGERVQRWMEVPLALLGIVMLGLLIAEFGLDLSPKWTGRVTRAETSIWVIFILAFAFEFSLAPSKGRYLRRNWLTVLAVALPALRVFRIVPALRVLRIGRAFRGTSVVRVVTTLNRGSRALSEFFKTNRLGYVVVLTIVVTLTSAAAVYYLEKGQQGANITSLGGAIWWAATIVTTVNSPLEPVTVEGRILAFGLRIFGLAIIGYITATIAVWLLGGASRNAAMEESKVDDLRRRMERIEQLLRERPGEWRDG